MREDLYWTYIIFSMPSSVFCSESCIEAHESENSEAPCQFSIRVIVFRLTVQWVSAALPWEDQTCACTWRTWPKIFWFCRLPPYLKVWRFLEDSLRFRCRYRSELTFVFGARDLNSVIQQTLRSGIWFSEDCELLYNRSSESPSLSFGRNHWRNSATNWNTASCYKERFQTPRDG